MSVIKVAIAGAGLRAEGYAAFALENPDKLEVVAVAEPNEARREKFKSLYKLREENCFKDWNELFAKPKLADAAFICTLDKDHYEPSVKALEAGYHVLLEKPMSPDPEECVEMG